MTEPLTRAEHGAIDRGAMLAWLVGLRAELAHEVTNPRAARLRPGKSPMEILRQQGIVNEGASRAEAYRELDAIVVLNGGRTLPLPVRENGRVKKS